MPALNEILEGSFALRAYKEVEGGKDYYLDNRGRPLVLEGPMTVQFQKVTTLLLRVGDGPLAALHFLTERDIMSAAAMVEVDLSQHVLRLVDEEHRTRLVLRKRHRRPTGADSPGEGSSF